MRRSIVAVVLNCVIPGAGLWYLGKPAWGLVNLLVVVLLALGGVLLLPQEISHNSIHYFVLGSVAACGGLAHHVALRTLRPDGVSEQSR